MGSSPVPFKVNLFLYYYVNKWLIDDKNRNLQKAHRFGSLFCFIDDLCAINDHLEFDKNYRNTYPSELELKKESISISKSISYQTSFWTF